METKSREVLTGPELETAYWSGNGSFRANLRAVEQAVLAKMDAEVRPCTCVCKPNMGYVSPSEARERERKAWDDAIRYAINTARTWPDAVAVRDSRYPSLIPPKPEGVTLSDGKVWRKDGSGWWVREGVGASPTALYGPSMTFCHTPEDFEAVARYLRDREAK